MLREDKYELYLPSRNTQTKVVRLLLEAGRGALLLPSSSSQPENLDFRRYNRVGYSWITIDFYSECEQYSTIQSVDIISQDCRLLSQYCVMCLCVYNRLRGYYSWLCLFLLCSHFQKTQFCCFVVLLLFCFVIVSSVDFLDYSKKHLLLFNLKIFFLNSQSEIEGSHVNQSDYCNFVIMASRLLARTQTHCYITNMREIAQAHSLTMAGGAVHSPTRFQCSTQIRISASF